MEDNINEIALSDEELKQVSGGGRLDPHDILNMNPAMESANQGWYCCGQCEFSCDTIEELNEHVKKTHRNRKPLEGAVSL